MKIGKVKMKKPIIYGTVVGNNHTFPIVQGGYYRYEDSDADSIYKVHNQLDDGSIMLQNILGGYIQYERPSHHYWKENWRLATGEEITRFEMLLKDAKIQSQNKAI